MNIDLVPERNFRERISGYYYFEFDDTKKIMNEEQKFVKTCEITFTRLNKVFKQIDPKKTKQSSSTTTPNKKAKQHKTKHNNTICFERVVFIVDIREYD